MITFLEFITEKIETNEDLRNWFNDKWVRMDTQGNIKGDCAREPGEGKPKCLPIAKARSMDKEDRASAVRRKRREDPVADRAGKGGAPINVKTEAVNFAQQAAIAIAKKKSGKYDKEGEKIKEEILHEKNAPTNPALWSRAKSLARSKFDVYPSAYANGWASKWYKSKGGGWKSIHESNNFLNQWDNEEPKKFVEHLTKEFGIPDELTNERAVWYNKDGFKRIEVKDEYTLHCCPAPHYDFVYTTVDLHVPKNFVRILAESSESIMLDLLKNEVTARCATLSATAVTINYVLDVVSKRVKGSKEEYESRIQKLYKNKLDPDPDWWPDTTKEVRK